MFENVQFFSHLHLKIAKSAIMIQKIFCWKISIWVSKKCRILCWFQIRWCRLKQMPLKKLEPRNYANFEYFRFCAFFRGFLILTFVRCISESRHQQIWNQHKILRFFDTHIDIFQEKKFVGPISTFCNYKMQMRKKLYIFRQFAKGKKLFFANIYHSPCDSYWNSKKSVKLKPPISHSLIYTHPSTPFMYGGLGVQPLASMWTFRDNAGNQTEVRIKHVFTSVQQF